MKILRLLPLLLFSLASPTHALTVYVTTAGNLANEVASAGETSVTDLKIVGKLNNADLKFLCSTKEGSGNFLTQNLKKLDLQDVTLEPTTGNYSVKGYGAGAVYYHLSKECSIVEDASGWLGSSIPFYRYYGDDLGGLCINMSSLEYIALPKKLRGLGQDCLQGSKVSTVVLPENMEYVKYNAFGDTPWYNKYLQSQPNGVVYYNDIAYSYKGDIPSNSTISFKEGTKRIVGKYSAFKQVNLPKTIKSIGDYCFSDISSISIPNGLEEIGYGAFEGCQDLTEINIPNSVTTIKDYAFSYCKGLSSAKIPNSVMSIGSKAFYDCSSLTSVEIPNSVTTIGKKAFVGCGKLSVVEINSNAILASSTSMENIFGSSVQKYIIGNSVTSIGENAFYDCSSLTSVVMPNSLRTIEKWAFKGCSGLISITFPNSLTSIGEGAFYGCNGLLTLTIPKSVTTIGKDAFRGCNSLYDIKVDTGNPIYDSRGNCGAIIETASNTLIKGCVTTLIPESVTTIGEYAFEGCSFDYVFIDSNVTDIGFGAFSNCKFLKTVEINSNSIISKDYPTNYFSTLSLNLKNIFGYQVQEYIIGNNVNSIGSYTFAGCSMTTVSLPESVTSIGKAAFYDCQSLTSITIPKGVTTIGDWMFLRCSSLTSVIIPEGVTTIGKAAFQKCSSLTSITFPNSLTSIGNGAFLESAWYDNQPDGLVYAGKVAYKYKGTMPENTSITIKDGTLSITENAFRSYNNLTSITIPNSVTTIGSDAFTGSGLSSVTLHCPNIEPWFYKLNIKEVILGDEVTSIGGSAFLNCSSLTSVKIGSNVKTIGSAAFSGCSSLTSVTIGKSVTDIGSSAFQDCNNLTDISIPDGVTNIGSFAFGNCNNLTYISIPESVTTIGAGAFDNTAWYNYQPEGMVYAGKVAYKYKGIMPANTSLKIEDGIKSLSDMAFFSCNNLASVTVPNSVTSIGSSAFCGCGNLTSVTMGKSVTDIGYSAFRDCSSLTDVYCFAEDIPSLGEYAFNNANIDQATLHVPAASISDYQEAEAWSQFARIVPLTDEEMTGIENVNADNHSKVKDSVIYGIDGRRLNQKQRGLNIIRMSDGTTRKVMVK